MFKAVVKAPGRADPVMILIAVSMDDARALAEGKTVMVNFDEPHMKTAVIIAPGDDDEAIKTKFLTVMAEYGAPDPAKH